VNIFGVVGNMVTNTANPVSFSVTVSDAQLNLEFEKLASDPQLCGIEIKTAPAPAPVAPAAPTAPAPAPSAYKISAGFSYTSATKDYWVPDTPFVTGGSISTKGANQAIANTTEDGLYRKERYGAAMIYKVPIRNGDYIVTMHVAELAYVNILALLG
jgi:Malectin domain